MKKIAPRPLSGCFGQFKDKLDKFWDLKLFNYVKIGQNGHLEASERFFSFFRPPLKFNFTYFKTLFRTFLVTFARVSPIFKGRKICKIGF